MDTMRDLLAPGDGDYVSLSASSTFDRDVWTAANQYPLVPGSNRMILVRDADKLARWDQLILWLSRTRALPNVYLVFISDLDDLPYLSVMGKKVLKTHVAALRAPRGSLVRCLMPAEDDAVAWVRRRATMDTATAKHLLVRTGGNLTAAGHVCAKLAMFTGVAGKASIDALVSQSPAADFANAVICGDKRGALLAVPLLPDADHGKLIALLDNRLDLLHQLHRLQISGQSLFGVNPYLCKQYLPYARDYNAARCTHRRRVLAVVDDALRSGARDGVFEALVALW